MAKTAYYIVCHSYYWLNTSSQWLFTSRRLFLGLGADSVLSYGLSRDMLRAEHLLQTLPVVRIPLGAVQTVIIYFIPTYLGKKVVVKIKIKKPIADLIISEACNII